GHFCTSSLSEPQAARVCGVPRGLCRRPAGRFPRAPALPAPEHQDDPACAPACGAAGLAGPRDRVAARGLLRPVALGPGIPLQVRCRPPWHDRDAPQVPALAAGLKAGEGPVHEHEGTGHPGAAARPALAGPGLVPVHATEGEAAVKAILCVNLTKGEVDIYSPGI